MIAPAWLKRVPSLRRLAADVRDDGLGDPARCSSASARSSSCEPPISPKITIASVCGSSWNMQRDVGDAQAQHRVAADVDDRADLHAGLAEVVAGARRHAARARDDADAAAGAAA